ncbi:DNA-binding protein [Duganella sp. Leaf126]|nr:DNA-binding protein [Duganella sp. Leaf126]
MPILPVTLPTTGDIALARESGRALSAVLRSRETSQQIDFYDEQGSVKAVSIPTSALRLLVDILTEIGQGNAVSMIPVHAELTTQQAADMLGVSRPFLIRLLENGDIPFHKTGAHRRVRFQDVMDYKQRVDGERRVALEELSRQAQELGLGY